MEPRGKQQFLTHLIDGGFHCICEGKRAELILWIQKTEVRISLALRSAPHPFNSDIPLHSYLSTIKWTSPPFSAPPSSCYYPDSILSLRMANPSTLLSSHHFPKNYALWLPILSPGLFTFSPSTGSFSRSHYCPLSKPTKPYRYMFPFTAKLPERIVYPFCLHFFTSQSLLKPLLHLLTKCGPSQGSKRGALFFTQYSWKANKLNNRSCLSLTLLFLLIYRSTFSPCLQQSECVSTYVWWWQESLRTRWGEQEYGRRDRPHLSASACCSPLYRQLTVAAEEEAWEQGEEGREGDKGNVTKGAVISLQKNTTLWAVGEKGQVQNVWSQNGRCDCARLCTIQTGPRRVSGEMDRPYQVLAMLQQPHSPCWATHLGAAVPTGPQDGADWTAAPSHLSRREPRDPAEAGEGPRGWDQICAEACRLQEPLRKLLRF